VQSEHLFEETGLDEEAISGDIIKIIREQMSMMEDNPLKRDYAFMYHFLPHRFYHGVEHAYTSSIVLGPASELKQKYDEFLSITSHEFFHLWCVKRIVPDVFAPYDYSREAYTTLLYIFEGFTSYYGDLCLVRSGLWPKKTYLDHLGKAINYVQHNYGRKVQTLGDSSYNAWLTGYRRGADLNSINFYVKGELVGLSLDFELRRRTAHAVTLDHVMRELNVRFAQKNKGFSEAEFETLVDELSDSSFKPFFDHYIRSTDEIPYTEILGLAGLTLQVAPDSACPSSIGAVMDNTATLWPTIKFAVPDSAAFKAGLDQNDTLVAIDQWQLQNKSLTDVLSKFKAGQSVEVSYIRGSELCRTCLILEENLTYKVIPMPEQTADQQEFWSKWTRSSY
jgi:predicted metalloprotease with PDZ domain